MTAGYHASHGRSAAKALTWRVLATTTTVALVYLFTGETSVALGVGGLEAVAKIILYYAHERGWDLIPWGKIHTT